MGGPPTTHPATAPGPAAGAGPPPAAAAAAGALPGDDIRPCPGRLPTQRCLPPPPPLQNVRRQCHDVWRSMRLWMDSAAADELLMATGVYDLDTGKVDFFGLHS